METKWDKLEQFSEKKKKRSNQNKSSSWKGKQTIFFKKQNKTNKAKQKNYFKVKIILISMVIGCVKIASNFHFRIFNSSENIISNAIPRSNLPLEDNNCILNDCLVFFSLLLFLFSLLASFNSFVVFKPKLQTKGNCKIVQWTKKKATIRFNRFLILLIKCNRWKWNTLKSKCHLDWNLKRTRKNIWICKYKNPCKWCCHLLANMAFNIWF